MVHLDFNWVVYCDELGGHCQVCDFFGLYSVNAQCGSCPLTNFGDNYINLFVYGCLDEILVKSCTKTKEDVASVTTGSQTTME